MICIIRSNDIVSDTRAMKYITYLKSHDIPYKLIAWDREGKKANDKSNYYFRRKAGYNVGGIKAAMNRCYWIIFVCLTLLKIKKDDNIVLHGCDVDSAFPASLYKKIFNRKAKVIFDIFDWFSSTLYNQHKLILKVFTLIEKFSINNADYIILCEKERIEQIPYSISPEKLLVLPNIPYFSEYSFLRKRKDYEFDNNKIVFSYVGGFYNERCLEEIIDIAISGCINLLIAGYGDSAIEKKLRESVGNPNIKYYGKVNYKDALSIMYSSDIIYAMYSKVNPNHIYAAPNKFYESMFLGKPIFTTKGTIVGNKVEKIGIGYVSNESESEILEAINTIKKDDIVEKGNKGKFIWEKMYKNYTNDFMETTYGKIIS